jgi:hypothetical protein
VNVVAKDDPLAPVAAMVTRKLTKPLLVHSTSWRRPRWLTGSQGSLCWPEKDIVPAAARRLS